MTLLVLVALLQAQNATPRPGFRAAPPAIFQQNCGTCHDGKQAPSITDLQQYSPERRLRSSSPRQNEGPGRSVSDVQKRQIAEFLAGRPMGSDEAGDMQKNDQSVPGKSSQLTDPAAGPSWNGWSPGDKNARFQSASGAGLHRRPDPEPEAEMGFRGSQSRGDALATHDRLRAVSSSAATPDTSIRSTQRRDASTGRSMPTPEREPRRPSHLSRARVRPNTPSTSSMS